MAKNGRYRRHVQVDRCLVWSWIYRRRCGRCRVSFSLLPWFVVPGMTYGHPLVDLWLWASLWSVSSRCRPLLEKYAVSCPAATPVPEVQASAWTDQLDSEPSRPGYQLLCRWASRFSTLAAEAIPSLVVTFVALRCHLRVHLADPLTVLKRVPERSYSLGLALGLWRAILEASRTDGAVVSLRDALPSLIGHLAEIPRSASHNLRRVSGDDVHYADTTSVGRAPPPPAVQRSGKHGQQVV